VFSFKTGRFDRFVLFERSKHYFHDGSVDKNRPLIERNDDLLDVSLKKVVQSGTASRICIKIALRFLREVLRDAGASTFL